MDSLQITGLSVKTYIGVYNWEQKILQPLLIDILIPKDFSSCEDQLANTLDYAKLCQKVTLFLETNRFQLIETVAESITQLIKKEFSVHTLTVSVSKPFAMKNVANVQVSLTR